MTQKKTLQLSFISAATAYPDVLIMHPTTNLPCKVGACKNNNSKTTLTLVSIDGNETKDTVVLASDTPIHFVSPELLSDNPLIGELSPLIISSLKLLDSVNVAGGLIQDEMGNYYPYSELDDDVPWTDLGNDIVEMYETLKEDNVPLACLIITPESEL